MKFAELKAIRLFSTIAYFWYLMHELWLRAFRSSIMFYTQTSSRPSSCLKFGANTYYTIFTKLKTSMLFQALSISGFFFLNSRLLKNTAIDIPGYSERTSAKISSWCFLKDFLTVLGTNAFCSPVIRSSPGLRNICSCCGSLGSKLFSFYQLMMDWTNIKHPG